MQFRQVDVYTKSEAIQVLVMRLSELGLNGFIIHDPADFEEFLENKEYNWDYVDDSLMGLKTVEPHITCYVQDNEQGAEMLSALGGTLDELKENDTDDFYGSLDVTIDCVREEDWANNWKQYYKPFTVGEKQIHEGDRMLDLGTGSGILSIAGLLLGAKQAVMVDIFENSVRTAKENTEKNGFGSDMVSAYIGNISDDEPLREKIGTGFDIITANIVADVIVSMSPYFSGFLKKNGRLIVSGIITERLDEVLSALKENNIKVESISEKEGWNAILCTCNP